MVHRQALPAILAFVMLCLVLLASPTSKAVASDLTPFYVVVTFVDQDIYLASLDPNRHPLGQSRQFYLRTAQCVRRSDKEPAVLALRQEEDRTWMVFNDGEICEVVNVSHDRGGI